MQRLCNTFSIFLIPFQCRSFDCIGRHIMNYVYDSSKAQFSPDHDFDKYLLLYGNSTGIRGIEKKIIFTLYAECKPCPYSWSEWGNDWVVLKK